jgi:hypothetical protein
VKGLQNYAGYLPIGPPLETLFKLALPPSLAPVLTWLTGALLLAWMVGMVWHNRRQNWLEFQITLGFVALVTTLVAVRIGSPDQLLLLILWLPWFSTWWAQGKKLAVALVAAFLLVLPWHIFLTTIEGNQEALIVSTLLPWFTLAVFVLSRLPGMVAARPRLLQRGTIEE